MATHFAEIFRSFRGIGFNSLFYLIFFFSVIGRAAADPIALLPYIPGTFSEGRGADARFVQLDGSWRGSTVLWDESNKAYGSGAPIGTFSWGTGLWGLADWRAALAAANGASGSGYPPIVGQWAGIAPVINYGNAMYNGLHSGLWGPATLVPLFTEGTPDHAQENWIAHFSGYIRVTESGAYSFGVLNDDGFFFRLIGAGGVEHAILRDYLNPRDRNGFGNEFLLDVGLYGFELGTWNRLEAGVVDLRWSLDGGATWTLVPTSSLLSASAVPSPSPLLLAVAALAAWAPVRPRRTRA